MLLPSVSPQFLSRAFTGKSAPQEWESWRANTQLSRGEAPASYAGARLVYFLYTFELIGI
jgi:hypothetical protein